MISSESSNVVTVVVLLGLRGVGKSSVGAIVARQLGREFVDLDPLTAAELGVGTAAEALRRFDVQAFREAESRALAAVLGEPRSMVFSLGGGTPTFEPSRAQLVAVRDAGGARLIYLHGTPAELRDRLALTDLSQRPALLGASALDEVGSLYTARDGSYRDLADAMIETGGRSAEDVAASVLASLITPR